MKKFAILLFLVACSFAAKADTLSLVFRFYDARGVLVPPAETRLEVVDGSSSPRFGDRHDPWQQWTIISQQPFRVLVIHGKDTLRARIDILERLRNGIIQTLVLGRLQNRGVEEQIKVNALTCSWTAGLAYALEYRYINPIDRHDLKFISRSCLPFLDSAAGKIGVLSDSVMLLTCGKSGAVFLKYRMDKDGYLYTTPSGFICIDFNTPVEAAIYRQLTDPKERLLIRYDNNTVILKSDSGCEWRFAF